MLELKFTIDEMKQLIKQGDASFLNEGNDSRMCVYDILYTKKGDFYFHFLQQNRISNEKEQQLMQKSKRKA